MHINIQPKNAFTILALLIAAALIPPTALADPIQQAYLKASDTRAYNEFGWSVALSGDTAVVGAYNPGAAYAFVRTGTNWGQQAYLKPSNADYLPGFGISVAVSTNTIVVGAPWEEGGATGVNGNQTACCAFHSGAAYVFVRSGTNWSQQAYLKASNTGGNDLFGYSVAVSGDTVVIGAPDEGSNATGVNGDQTNNSAGFSGAVYVFVRNGTNWSQEAYLKAFNTGEGDEFGWSVALSGDTVLVGAPNESSNATGVNGNQNNNSAGGSGAAYVFVRSGTNWSQEAYLKASNTRGPFCDFSCEGATFGWSVAVSSNTVVVGAGTETSNATGVNGNQSDTNAPFAGAAYVFVRDGTNWSQQAYLKASNTDADDYFGRSVSVSRDTVVVGAFAESSTATGVNGNENDNSEADSGAAYVFVRSGTNWSQQAYLKASNADRFDYFGRSVAVSGDSLVIGANGEQSNATTVNGDGTNNNADEAGAAYIFAGVGTPAIPPRLISPSLIAQDQFRFTLLGAAGRSYTIQASTNLVNWIALTNFVSATGTNQFSDSTAPNFNRRFYRAVMP